MIVDSNIVIYYANPAYRKLREYLEDRLPETFVSAISRVEVLGYHRIMAEDKAKLESFFTQVLQYPVSERIIERATQLRQRRKMSLGDALIAATCLIHDEPLLTNNEADFDGISGLTVIPMRNVL